MRTRYVDGSGRYPAVNSLTRVKTRRYKVRETSNCTFQEYLTLCMSCVGISDKCVRLAPHYLS